MSTGPTRGLRERRPHQRPLQAFSRSRSRHLQIRVLRGSGVSDPERTCAGCGRKAPQAELLRFGCVENRLVAGRTVPGRGVYTCRRLACFERARASRAFNRVLRRTVVVDPDLSRIYTEG